MTEAIYLEVSEKTEAAKTAGRRVSVSGMLKFLCDSRSGYLAWLHHVPSDTEKRRKAVKAKIQDIYDDSKQNYGAPKITVKLRKTGEVISERTVGTYMRQMGIRAQWSKPWTIATKDSDFSTELQNILDEQFNPDRPNAVSGYYLHLDNRWICLSDQCYGFIFQKNHSMDTFKNTGSILRD